MRGPLLSGPLGTVGALEAMARWLDGTGAVAVIGQLWLGDTLSAKMPILLLTEAEERDRARRVARRATAAGRRLTIVLAGVDLPLGQGTVGALLIDGAATLDAESFARWMQALVPALRPGGRLIAVDATANPTVEARLAGVFLGSAMTEIVQERPREGVLITVGVAPPAPVIKARFSLSA
jgi:hypothetical protein